MYLKISLFTKLFLNRSVLTLGRRELDCLSLLEEGSILGKYFLSGCSSCLHIFLKIRVSHFSDNLDTRRIRNIRIVFVYIKMYWHEFSVLRGIS